MVCVASHQGSEHLCIPPLLLLRLVTGSGWVKPLLCALQYRKPHKNTGEICGPVLLRIKYVFELYHIIIGYLENA